MLYELVKVGVACRCTAELAGGGVHKTLRFVADGDDLTVVCQYVVEVVRSSLKPEYSDTDCFHGVASQNYIFSRYFIGS